MATLPPSAPNEALPEQVCWPVQRYDLTRVASTNDFALTLLHEGAPEGTLVLAYEQYAGRGQRSSSWLVAPGLNLTLSLILRPGWLGHSHLFALNKIATLAIHALLVKHLPRRAVRIKWPNDVLVNGKKIAGILIENQLAAQHTEASVLGIGLNVNQTLFLADVQEQATSLLIEMGKAEPAVTQPFALDPILAELLAHLQQQYERLRMGATDAINRAYLTHLYQYQEWAQYEQVLPARNRVTFKGMIIGLLQDGRLAVQHDSDAQGKTQGSIRYYNFKEIAFKG